MKVIFIKDLKKQGKVNEVKEVSDGYAVNYLIKNGYTVKYTKTSSSILDKDLESKKNKDAIDRKNALLLKKKLENVSIKFLVKSNNGRVFGSISSKQISEKLKELGFNIDKKSIAIVDSLNTIGVHVVKIHLYKDIVCDLSVMLVIE